MAAAYDHKKIEKKWQKRWEEGRAFRPKEESGKEKLYVLDMFPYPSGAGLHVGHVEGYTATDIYSRFKRMQGYNVLHPMGWDAFGLPAENYAIKTGVAPQKTTDEAIASFRSQIQSLGLSYDWEREIGTHTPEYYKWTQWFFLFLYKNGLAEKRMAKVNWCPKDQTVLANEQTVSESGEKGVCVRCGTKVVQKDLEQWFFKITDFADQLVDDLDQVDWPESTKINQRNWIGRSEGAEIDFAVAQSGEKIKVFTTRPDTLFGATYMVLAPEHTLIKNLADKSQNKDEILRYVEAAKNKTDLERQEETKDKTGVEIKGVRAINPANGEEIPIFVADYVLGGYGTGAIMAVPAHDERDYQFAKKFNLPIREVISPIVGSETRKGESLEKLQEVWDHPPFNLPGTLINSGAFDSVSSEEAKQKITESVGGRMVRTYRLRDWLISRQRYWGAPIPVVYDPSGKAHPIPEEHLPWILPTDVEYLPHGTSPLATSKELLARTEKIFGKGWKPEADTMDTFVCSSWYYFRFADPHNEKEFASPEAIKKWLPVDLYMGGAEHTVLHLMYARFITKVLRRQGLIAFNEPFLKLRHQGTILAEDGSKMSKSKGNVINPDEVVERFGADTLRLYEMFMGPLEASKPWNTQNILGVRRFLERVWKLHARIRPSADPVAEPVDVRGSAEGPLHVLLNQTIKKVGEDIEALKLNTAVSSLMILLNSFDEQGMSEDAYKIFLILLAPLAPHIASELWERGGFEGEAVAQPWPQFDPAKIAASTARVAVQVNGKLRAAIDLPAGMGEGEALEAARRDPAVAKWLALGKEVKAVYVPSKVINFVVQQI